jgi:hypothetical protein
METTASPSRDEARPAVKFRATSTEPLTNLNDLLDVYYAAVQKVKDTEQRVYRLKHDVANVLEDLLGEMVMLRMNSRNVPGILTGAHFGTVCIWGFTGEELDQVAISRGWRIERLISYDSVAQTEETAKVDDVDEVLTDWDEALDEAFAAPPARAEALRNVEQALADATQKGVLQIFKVTEGDDKLPFTIHGLVSSHRYRAHDETFEVRVKDYGTTTYRWVTLTDRSAFAVVKAVQAVTN